VPVSNGDATGFADVGAGLGTPGQARSRSAHRHGDAAALRWFLLAGGELEGPYVGDRPADVLLGKGKIVRRQNAPIQGARELFDPTMMKGMKQSRIHTCPVVNRHGR